MARRLRIGEPGVQLEPLLLRVPGAPMAKRRSRNRDTPIIFMTAHDQSEADLSRGYSLGAVDFIHAPLHRDVLYAKTSVFVELWHKAQEVKQLYIEAQEASRAKSEFLNMAAHELRTPLSVVRGYLSMLLKGVFDQLPDSSLPPLEIVEAKTGELNAIVDSLLTAARIDEARVPVRPEQVDLAAATREAVARAEGRRVLLRATVRCEVPEHPVAVKADPAHVGRILDNLINNALTYCVRTPHLRITVDENGSPSVAVEDNGVGIPEDRQQAIFERFVRIEDKLVGPTPGTGLGLHISRELARLAGGDLVLERSRRGHGSRFVLALPAAAGPPRSPGQLRAGRSAETAQV